MKATAICVAVLLVATMRGISYTANTASVGGTYNVAIGVGMLC